MGLFGSQEFNTLEDLFCHQLEDLYDAEMRLAKALPKVQQATHTPALKAAFEHHLRETQNHVNRLEQVFQQLGHHEAARLLEATLN